MNKWVSSQSVVFFDCFCEVHVNLFQIHISFFQLQLSHFTLSSSNLLASLLLLLDFQNLCHTDIEETSDKVKVQIPWPFLHRRVSATTALTNQTNEYLKLTGARITRKSFVISPFDIYFVQQYIDSTIIRVS